MGESISKRINAVRNANAANFVELAGIARLDPARDFRYSNWSHINFHDCDLSGFDFTGADLSGCNFTGAKIVGATFVDAIDAGSNLNEVIIQTVYQGAIGGVVVMPRLPRSIWDKLAGALAGLAEGEPEGALIGEVAGRGSTDRVSSDEEDQSSLLARQMAFTLGVVALGAKIAKADGSVTLDEVQAFKEVFVIHEDDAESVERIFDLARRDAAGFEVYARQLADLFANDHETLRDVLDGLFHIAKADNVMHPGEERFLAEVARIFGFSDAAFQCLRVRHVMGDKASAYQVLGVEPSISDDDLNAHYRKVINENLPDRLAARGLPTEFVATAARKVVEMREAFEEIQRERRAS